MNCLECDGTMVSMRVKSANHTRVDADWTTAFVCRRCTPETFRRYSRS